MEVIMSAADYGSVPASRVATVILVTTCLLAASGSVASAAAKLRCDFDGDGRSDLAIGVPGDNNGRGAVNVQYSKAGFLDVGAYFRRGLNLPGLAAAHQRVGSSLACGNFNGDPYADLAVSAPGETNARGAVLVVYGSAQGLTNLFNTYLTQDTILGAGAAEDGDRFGESLAAGDFDGDGRDDLAIGSPGEDAETANAAGEVTVVPHTGLVNVMFGSSSGLIGPAQSFSPATPGACCVSGANAHYGASLAVGDFDGDGVEDLAIGAPFATVSVDHEEVIIAGSVHQLRGETNTGLVLDGQNYLTEQDFTTRTKPHSGELFGLSLAAGQFNGAGGDDLAIGAPFEQFENELKPGYIGFGAVYVAYFSGADLSAFETTTFVDDTPTGDGFGDNERFGWALAAANFDGQNDDDLVIGIPRNVPDRNQRGVSGSAVAIFSDGTKLSKTGAQFFYPGDSTSGVQTPPAPEGVEMMFGAALAAGDYQGDGVADLFIGVPALSLAHSNQGGVEIRPGVAGAGFGNSYLLLTQDTWQPGQTWQAATYTKGFSTELPYEYSTAFTFVGERMGHALSR
jgi:hypothetical protein